MNNIDHLSDWQIEELLIGPLETRGGMPVQYEVQCDLEVEAEVKAQDQPRIHLDHCPLCSARKKRLEDTLLLYREAALIEANDASQRALAANHSKAAQGTPTFSAYPLLWGWRTRAFAFLLLLVVLIPAFVTRERERHEAQQATRNHVLQQQAKDDLLLEQVDQEITESVPQPMQSLTQPVLDDGTEER
jgi:hypothetical protein